MIKTYGNFVVNFDHIECALPSLTNSDIRGIEIRFVSGHSFILLGDNRKSFLKDANAISALTRSKIHI